MIEIDLIRHVRVFGEPALYGSTDVSTIKTEHEHLLERLIEQHQASPYQSITSSPLIRCKHTAKELSKAIQLPLSITAGFQEMNFGDYDGVPFDDLAFSSEEAVNPTLNATVKDISTKMVEQGKLSGLSWPTLEAFFQAPGENTLANGESLADFNDRIVSAWQVFIEDLADKAIKDDEQLTSNNSQRIAVLTHGGVVRIILAHILGLDWKSAALYQQLHIGNGSLTRIRISKPFAKEACQNTNNSKAKPLAKQATYNKLHQQVTTIAMPLLEK